MAYIDPTFNTRVSRFVVGSPASGVALGTVSGAGGGTDTYSAAAGTAANGVYVLPKFARATKITGIQVYVITAPGGGVTNEVMTFMNGTSTIATATMTTANKVVSATMNDVNSYSSAGALTNPCIVAAGGQPGLVVTNTNTATASTLGTFAIEFETSEVFVN